MVCEIIKQKRVKTPELLRCA